MSDWHGIMKILWIKHWRDGEMIWEAENIKNLLHREGESFILRAAFTGGQQSNVIPANYYIGLDARFALNVEDNLTSLIGEPSGNGYIRQAVSSNGESEEETGGFVLTLEGSNYRVTSPIVAFDAVLGNWGPVNNIFLTDSNTSNGNLISSAALPSTLTVASGDTVTMRFGLVLKDCP